MLTRCCSLLISRVFGFVGIPVVGAADLSGCILLGVSATAPEVTVCVAGFTDPRFWVSGRVPPIDKITNRPAAAAAAAPKSAADQNGDKIAQIVAIANLAHQLPNVYTSARVASELANTEALFAED